MRAPKARTAGGEKERENGKDLNALKIENEAVGEGMGSTVDRHAQAVRGLKQETYTMESFIEYNGPESSEADGFLTAALNLHFKGKPWHFQHIYRQGREKHIGMPAMISRLHKRKSKLPFLVEG
ncbi:hypothetical protein CYMTET_32466 [Cymbomonas tetramitiformis]|uniref:Uncharacterized protein n=1 Tax=Cymbomonas tetramitiformis TaxID=36881 RepID=A0AAE0FF00_9CHLO|nr:hypothetical protein CYMTET_32466 [Cymbomonas tetramitiformis]